MKYGTFDLIRDHFLHLGLEFFVPLILEVVVDVEGHHGSKESKIKRNIYGISQLLACNREIEIGNDDVYNRLNYPEPPSSGIEFSVIHPIWEIHIFFLIIFFCN